MISRGGSHAIRAVLRLGELPEGRFAGAGEIAGDVGAPANYLGKLLQTLSRAGLVESRRGVGGGFRLARAATSITLLEILEPIERKGRWDRCVLGLPVCSDAAPCALHDRWKGLSDSFRMALARTTVAEIPRPNTHVSTVVEPRTGKRAKTTARPGPGRRRS